MNRREFLLTGLAGLTLRPGVARAQNGGWSAFPAPFTDSGLFLSPRLQNVRGRLYIFWAGTTTEARAPEMFTANASDGDSDWTKPRAPFFGSDMGRVRRLAVANTRDTLAMVFQRETTQGNGAVEVLLTISSDSAYTWSNPFVMDSYVLGEEGGSYVSIAGRQGVQRAEFAACWVAEGGAVRASNIDTRSGFRPRALPVGNLTSIKGKAEVLGAGKEGFYAVWPEEKTLRSARVKPLTGVIEPAATVQTGEFLRFFATASHQRGPGFLVAAPEGGDLSLMEAKDEKLALLDKKRIPLVGRQWECRAALDGDNKLHLALLEPGARGAIYYVHNRGGSWSAPEKVVALREEAPMTGYDIAVTEDYCWVVAGQNQIVHMLRRKRDR